MDPNQDFLCGICLDIATQAVETTCCHQIFCETCVSGQDNCPMCRKTLDTAPSFVVRRIIGRMPIECEFCKVIVERGNLESHNQVCPGRNIDCIVDSCTFKGKKEILLTHMVDAHTKELTSGSEYKLVSSKNLPAPPKHNDLISAKVNAYNRPARLGSSGKYYCKGRLRTSCRCCDGACGPTNGCNCEACFILDLETRNLPKGYFLNRAGFVVRKGSNAHGYDGSNTFYCGRKVMNPRRDTDGWCGPTNGSNCLDCSTIQRQLSEGGCYHQVYLSRI